MGYQVSSTMTCFTCNQKIRAKFNLASLQITHQHIYQCRETGNKVRVCYHLCIRRTNESVFVLHIISEIKHHLTHNLSYVAQCNDCLAIFSFIETFVNGTLKFPKCSKRPDGDVNILQVYN